MFKFWFEVCVNNVQFRKVKMPKSITTQEHAIQYVRDWIARKDIKQVPRVQINLFTKDYEQHGASSTMIWGYRTSETIPPVQKELLSM